VLRVRFVADAQPEKAYQYDSLVTNHGKCRGAGRFATAWDSPPRPLRLVRQPVPVAATFLLPDGPPVRFLLRGQEHRIAHAWGPERIETAWWRGPMIARDYYRVETAAGQRYWLFRRLDDGRWFVHGAFE
jgi:protein ImuB